MFFPLIAMFASGFLLSLQCICNSSFRKITFKSLFFNNFGQMRTPKTPYGKCMKAPCLHATVSWPWVCSFSWVGHFAEVAVPVEVARLPDGLQGVPRPPGHHYAYDYQAVQLCWITLKDRYMYYDYIWLLIIFWMIKYEWEPTSYSRHPSSALSKRINW